MEKMLMLGNCRNMAGREVWMATCCSVYTDIQV